MEFLGISQSMASPTLNGTSFSPPVRRSRKPLGTKNSSDANDNRPAAVQVLPKSSPVKSPGSEIKSVGSVAAHEAETLLWDQWEDEQDEEKMSPSCE